MREFCTYFDRAYLVRALTLRRSLKQVVGDLRLWALCFDDESYELLVSLALPDVRPISVQEFEARNPDLARVKASRSRVEYYFTCSPLLPRFVFDAAPEIEDVTYVDADLYFFSGLEPITSRWDDASILIIPHGFPPHLRDLEKYGRYNVGLVAFRNDEVGRFVLARWAAQCLDWCFDRVDGGRFADQAYLDDWPELSPRVAVLDVPGVGLGPWNFMRFQIDFDGSEPTVDGHPLVFYHYQGFREVGPGLYVLGFGTYATMPDRLRHRLYGSYVQELRRTRKWLGDTVGQRPGLAPSGRRSNVKALVRGVIRSDIASLSSLRKEGLT